MIPALRRRLSALFARGGVLRNVFNVAGATAASQLIGFAGLPILGRRFDAEAFGLFGLFFTLTTTVASVATLGLHEAILTPHCLRDARILLGVTIISATGMSVVLAAACAVMIAMGLFGLKALPLWSAAAIMPCVWLMAMAVILQIWLIRRREFVKLSRATLGLGIARTSAQLVASLAAATVGWLGPLAGELTGRGACVLLMARGSWKEIGVSIRLALCYGWDAIVRHRSFVLLRTPSHFANNLSSALPLFLLSRSFDAAQIGAFSFMIGVVAGPIGLAIRGVGDVFLGEFANRFRTDQAAAQHFLLLTVCALAGVAALTVGVVLLFGPDLFALLFGERWRLSGVLAIAYLPLLGAQLVVAPVGGVLFVCNHPGSKLAVDLTSIALQLAAAAIAQMLHLEFVTSAATICGGAASSFVLYGVLIASAVQSHRILPRA